MIKIINFELDCVDSNPVSATRKLNDLGQDFHCAYCAFSKIRLIIIHISCDHSDQ